MAFNLGRMKAMMGGQGMAPGVAGLGTGGPSPFDSLVPASARSVAPGGGMMGDKSFLAGMLGNAMKGAGPRPIAPAAGAQISRPGFGGGRPNFKRPNFGGSVSPAVTGMGPKNKLAGPQQRPARRPTRMF